MDEGRKKQQEKLMTGMFNDDKVCVDPYLPRKC